MPRSNMNTQTGMPQHFRLFDFLVPPSFLESGNGGGWSLTRELLVLVEECQRADGGVPMEGDGNAARMSEIEPARDDFALAPKISIRPVRLAVLARSKLAASLVALRMSSGRLLWLALDSPSLERFRRAGRFDIRSLLDDVIEGCGETVGLDGIAPPFSRCPMI